MLTSEDLDSIAKRAIVPSKATGPKKHRWPLLPRQGEQACVDCGLVRSIRADGTVRFYRLEDGTERRPVPTCEAPRPLDVRSVMLDGNTILELVELARRVVGKRSG